MRIFRAGKLDGEMSPGLRIFWLVSLCVFMSGCAGYRPAQFPQSGASSDIEEETELETVGPGDEVRIGLVDGRVVEGEVVSLDGEWLRVEEELPGHEDVLREDNVVMHEIPLSDVVSVDRYHSRKAVMAVIGVGAAVLTVVAVVVLGREVNKEMQENR